jgi:hypothetical protein
VKFAKIVFLAAAIWGLLALLPMYFLRERIGQDFPPAITHPEFFYGFVGLAVVWQLAFLVIASDPARFRPLMVVSVLEKLSFGIPCVILFSRGELAAPMLFAGSCDLFLGLLFAIAYLKTPRA